MSKVVVIHQPDFLSYLGFFHRLLYADLFVILDTAQYVNGTSRSWMNRDKIKTAKGEQWLTIGIKKAPHGTRINHIYLSQKTDWKIKNLNLLKQAYQNAPYFDDIFPEIEKLYECKCNLLWEFNLQSIKILMKLFKISTDIILSSVLNPEGKSNSLLINILKKVEATTYLSGIGAVDYLDPKAFSQAGLDIRWQEFKHPVYPQLHEGFVPYLSSIDLLFNCGEKRSGEILRSI
jgi:WbqC-like protein